MNTEKKNRGVKKDGQRVETDYSKKISGSNIKECQNEKNQGSERRWSKCKKKNG